jgi:hypothetical protein
VILASDSAKHITGDGLSLHAVTNNKAIPLKIDMGDCLFIMTLFNLLARRHKSLFWLYHVGRPVADDNGYEMP